MSLKIHGLPLGLYESHALTADEGGQTTQVIGDAPLTGRNNQIVPRDLKLKTVDSTMLDPMIQDKIDQL